MEAAARRNNAAKAAIESALFDAVGKTLGVPAVQLLGGAVRESLPVLWTLASGDPAQEIEEAERKLAARLHNTFKVKIGAQTPEADIARLSSLARALTDRASLIVDANQAWDETTALRYLPVLAELGVRLVEQPLPAWNLAGMARLRARSTVPLMADECVFSAHDMLDVVRTGAADVVSLKLVKHGGLLATRNVAAVAEAAGIGLYGAACWRARSALRRICRSSADCVSSPGVASISARRSSWRIWSNSRSVSRTSKSTCRPGPVSV
jgi:muconate cycloisomerase